VDVFGRLPACRACHALLANLQGVLVPRLERQLRLEARRLASGGPDSRRVDVGAYEALVQEELPLGCAFSSTYHDKDARVACRRLLEEHEDALGEAYLRWVRTSRSGAAADWSWNRELCLVASAACPPALAARPLSDFADDGSGASERRYRSEPQPAPGARVDGLLTLVAASFDSAVRGDGRGDLLVYVAFPRSLPEAHAAVWPALVAAAPLLRAAGCEVGVLDADANDAPPPHDAGARAPGLIMYPGGAKGTPRFTQAFADGRLTLLDVLSFAASTAGVRATVEAAERAMVDTGEAAQRRLLARPWEEDEEAWEAEPAWTAARRLEGEL